MPAEWAAAFAALCQKTHREQAIWWLNGSWNEPGSNSGQKIAPDVWKIAHVFLEVDGTPVLYGGKMKEFKENCDLDEFKAHVALEKLGEVMTVQQLRKHLQALDIDNNKRMSLSEYLLNKYKRTPEWLVNAPQGNVDPAKLKAAEDSFAAANEALDQAAADAATAAEALAAAEQSAKLAAEALAEAQAAAAAAAAALAAAQAAAAAAAAALAEAQQSAADAAEAKRVADHAKAEADKAAEAAASALTRSNQAAAAAAEAKATADKRAQEAAGLLAVQEAAEKALREAAAELAAARADLEAQEKARADKIKELEAIAEGSGGAATKGKAKNEIAQLKGEDPMPLRKAKITLAAAQKKADQKNCCGC